MLNLRVECIENNPMQWKIFAGACKLIFCASQSNNFKNSKRQSDELLAIGKKFHRLDILSRKITKLQGNILLNMSERFL